MNWTDATRGLADLLVHSDPAGALSVAVFGPDDELRERFGQETRREIDLLLPDDAARIEVDFRARAGEWVWSAALCGFMDSIGQALVDRQAAPGEDSVGHRVFHDLSIVERAVAAARKAAAAARSRMPDVRAVVGDARQDVDVARQRRADLEAPGSDVAEEIAGRDAVMTTLLARSRALSDLLGAGAVHPHGLADTARDVGGPLKQLWRSIRFALSTGGLWVMLGVLVIVYGGVLAWELLPVTHWLGPKVVGVDMRPVAAAISWLTVIVVLFPGYKRAFLLRRIAYKASKHWKKVLESGRELLDQEIAAAQQELRKAEKRLDATARIGATEDKKVAELMSGVGLGGFIGRLLASQGGSMERWARTFDGARTDIDTAIRRLNAELGSPVRRLVLFVEGVDERSAEATDTLGVLRYLSTLQGVSLAAPVDPQTLRHAANAQQENPRIEKALMFMEGDAKEFVAPLPPQEALDRSFHLGVFAPRDADGAPAKANPPAGALPKAVATGSSELAEKLVSLAPDAHKRRRLVEVLRWVRCSSNGQRRAALNGIADSAKGENDVQAVMLLTGVMLGDPDHAQGFLNALEVTTHEDFAKFIEGDLRPGGGKGKTKAQADAEGPEMSAEESDAWMGLCRKLLQVKEHTPGAQTVELLQRWSGLVTEAAAGSMPLVHPLPVIEAE